jgi:hypothetical protein
MEAVKTYREEIKTLGPSPKRRNIVEVAAGFCRILMLANLQS